MKKILNNIGIKSLFLLVIMIISIVLIGTYAWFSWRSNDTALVLTMGEFGELNVSLYPYKFNSDIAPSTTYEENEYT